MWVDLYDDRFGFVVNAKLSYRRISGQYLTYKIVPKMGDYSNGRERRLKSVSVLVQIQNRLPTKVDNHDFYYAHLGRLLCAQLGLW